MEMSIPEQNFRLRKEQAEFVVGKELDGRTCGEFLKISGVSRRLVTKLKRVDGGITRNGIQIKTPDIVFAGERIVLKSIDNSLLEPNPSLDVPVAYDDNDVIVYCKPAGMPVHPSIKHQGDTLGNCFAAMFPELTFRPVNRLDKDTSGLCAVAKSAYAANYLSGKISKVYMAVTEGVPVPRNPGNPDIKWDKTGSGFRIEASIGRAVESIIRRKIRSDGQKAVTNYTIVKTNEKFSLLRIELETGRTHQIRVHFSSVGHPLAGDDFYGGSTEFCPAQALHCGEMSFPRPSDGKIVQLFSEIRPDMSELLTEQK